MDADEASDNSEEYAERAAQLARIALAASSGPRGKRALQAAAAASRHAAQRQRATEALAALAATRAPQLALAMAVATDDGSDANGGRQHRHHPFVRRATTLLASAHAALTSSELPPSADVLQNALHRAAARPPWPPLAVAAARAPWSVATLAQLLDDQWNVRAVGCVRLPAERMAMVGEWLTDGAPAGVAFAVVCIAAAGAAAADALFAGDLAGVALARLNAATRDAPHWWYSHTALVGRALLDVALVGIV